MMTQGELNVWVGFAEKALAAYIGRNFTCSESARFAAEAADKMLALTKARIEPAD